MNIKELLRNKKVLLLSIIAILLAVLSVSYAYYMFSESQAGNNIGGSDCFKLTYKDKNNITLNDAIPLSEEEGSSLTPYEFTIKNVCKGAAEYDINLEKLKTSDMDDKFLRIKLDNNESFIFNTKEIVEQHVNNNVTSSRKIGEGLLLANEEKTYFLRMWIDEDATIEATEKTFESKVVVISKLNKNPYQSITLNLDGGTIEGDTTLQGVVKQTLGDKLKNPSKEGYNFIGWYSTNTFDNGTGVSQDTIVTNSLSNLYANYTKGTYELTIDEDNGNISTHQVEYQSTYNLNTPTKVGYTFDHYEIVSGNSSISDNNLTMGSEATRVKAIYNINSYTLTITNSNTCDGEHTIDYNSTYELCTPSKTGYTFSGWNYSSGNLSGNAYTIGASNVTIEATWTINTYKWLVNHNKMNLDGLTYTLEETTTGQGEYNTTYPTSDIRKTYTGFTKPDPYPTSTIGVDKTPIEEGYATNNILDYNYTRNKYDLVINPNGGKYNNTTESTTINEYYEKEITISNPTRDGYTFNGWSNEANFTNTTYKMPIGGETITASWIANQYTITFNVNGGDTLTNNTKEVTYDSTYGSLPIPTRTNYTFGGWYTEQNNGTKIESTSDVKIIENTTLFAHWNPLLKDFMVALTNGASTTSTVEIGSTGLAYDGNNNLRYVGADPNNYIYFNCSDYTNQNDSTCEKWRIIGKYGNNVKIIRNDSIGKYSWDSSASGVNNGIGVNEWSQADIMTELNGIYYNAQSGTCYNNPNNGTTTCDFRTIGLKNDTTRNAIENYTWNTGAANGSQIDSYSFPAATYYANERSSYTGKQCSSGDFCNDTVSRTTSWTGKVALMYPSDYIYAVGGSVRNTCLSMKAGESSFGTTCKDYDWLYSGWTLAPRASSSGAYSVFSVNSNGRIGSSSASDTRAVRPAVFLKSSIAILSEGGGDGSSSHPYKLAL